MLRQAVEASRGKLGAEHGQTLFRDNLLAKVLAKQGKTKEAEELYRQTLDALRRVRSIEHSNTLTVQTDLAAFLRNQGKKPDAEALYRDVLAVCRRARAPITSEHSLLRKIWQRFSKTRANSRRRKTSTVQCGRLARVSRARNTPKRLPPWKHWPTSSTSTNRRRRPKNSIANSWPHRRKVSPADHPDIATRLAALGSLLSDAGRPAEAEPLLRECVTIREKKLPAGHWQAANARSVLGGCLVRQKKFADAEPHLLAGYEGLTKAKDAPAKRDAEALDRVIELYEKWGKPEKAEEWRKKRPAASK